MEPRDLPALADVVLRLADVCAELAVPYAIGGAVATSFWGVPRTTQDADCLVAVPAVAYQRLADALERKPDQQLLVDFAAEVFHNERGAEEPGPIESAAFQLYEED